MSVDSRLTELADVFRKMDDEYARVSRQYGFHCRGCGDNCCATHFHHHTHVEYLHFSEGIKGLAPSARANILQRARQVIEDPRPDDRETAISKRMCPVNEDGLCLLYAHRPMICRLHGLPHEVRYPGGGVHTGPGCADFHATAGDRPYIRFDRTPFYAAMAAIEGEVKKAMGPRGPFRRTVAEMLVMYGDENRQSE